MGVIPRRTARIFIATLLKFEYNTLYIIHTKESNKNEK